MKQSRIVMGLFALLIAFTISGCKDDEDPTANKSKTVLLTQNTWVYSTALPSNDPNVLLYGAFEPSEYQFKSDNTYSSIVLTFSDSGKWEFTENETKLILNKGDADNEYSYKIKTLNDSVLELIVIDPDLTKEITLQYKKK